ncbi:MAG TPA: hypothetical protein VJT84_02045 [Gaiellaceae bacterium]|nr:hypothetical protein [Gaiellaceae bacterium]
MPTYILWHAHRPEECRIAYAAWRGFDSPLRREVTLGSCVDGGHELWWTVVADDAASALAQLPFFLAARTRLSEVTATQIP